MVGSGDPRGSKTRGLPRGARRLGRRLRRTLKPHNLVTVALLIGCFAVIMDALTGPPSRATVYRTDPVLRAMGIPEEEPESELAALAAVPSLSVSPRFGLSPLRDEGKRLLAALPLPEQVPRRAEPGAGPEPEHQAAVAAVAQTPAEAVEIARPGAVPVPLAPAAGPPRPSLKPRHAAPPLSTAVVMTPVLPRRERFRHGSSPELAIIIDDIGPAPALSRRAIHLPRPITLAFLPYAEELPALTSGARARGHEIFMHLPMEPIGTPNPGPNAILVGLEPDEFRRRLSWAFERVQLATGVNNHMGSRATTEPETMLKVLQEVRRRGLAFVDSRTSPLSVGDGLAAQLDIPHASRDVFLDNNPSPVAIRHMLAAAESLARKRGHALAIGHPYPSTLAVLERWLPEAEARGLRIVRTQDLIATLRCRESQPLVVSACIGPDCPPPPSC